MSNRKPKIIKSPSQPDEGRRAFMRDILMAGVGAVLARPMDNVAMIVAGLFDKAATAGDRAALASLINTERGIQVFAGNTNKLAAAAGRPGLSPYLRNSAELFGAFVVKSLGDEERFKNVTEEDARLGLDIQNNDLILMGGPVANNLGAKFTGYDFIPVIEGGKELPLPIFNHASRLRWGFYCGATAYGSWGSKLFKAKRYENGGQVERPLYGLWDLTDSSKNPRPFALDDNGFLKEEALLITRVSNPFSRDRAITTVGGVHGYSALAFFSKSEENLKALNAITRGAHLYQVMVPVPLRHDHVLNHSFGILDWSAAKIFTETT